MPWHAARLKHRSSLLEIWMNRSGDRRISARRTWKPLPQLMVWKTRRNTSYLCAATVAWRDRLGLYGGRGDKSQNRETKSLTRTNGIYSTLAPGSPGQTHIIGWYCRSSGGAGPTRKDGTEGAAPPGPLRPQRGGWDEEIMFQDLHMEVTSPKSVAKRRAPWIPKAKWRLADQRTILCWLRLQYQCSHHTENRCLR